MDLSIIISISALLVSVAAFGLRIWDRLPNFEVRAEHDKRHGVLVMTVVNKGQVEATLSRLFLDVYQSSSHVEQLELTESFSEGDFDLPKRILFGDRVTFNYEVKILREQLKAKGYKKGRYLLQLTAEDGRRRRHKGQPFYFEVSA